MIQKNINEDISVIVSESDGWFMATSPQMPELIICNRDINVLHKIMPECIKFLYKVNHCKDVNVEEII